MGNIMIGAGIVLLLITVYLAYNLYQSISSASFSSTATGLPLNSSISKSVGMLVSGLLSNSTSFLVVLLKQEEKCRQAKYI